MLLRHGTSLLSTLGCQINEYTCLFGTKEIWRKKQTQRQTRVFHENPPYPFIWHLRVCAFLFLVKMTQFLWSNANNKLISRSRYLNLFPILSVGMWTLKPTLYCVLPISTAEGQNYRSGGSPRLIIKVPVSSSNHKIRSNTVWFGCLHEFFNSKIEVCDLDSWFTEIKKIKKQYYWIWVVF